NRTLVPGKPDPFSLRARVETLSREQNSRLRKLLVVLAHFRQDLPIGQHARFRILVCLDDDHESHVYLLALFGVARSSRPLNPALLSRRTGTRKIDTVGKRFSALDILHDRMARRFGDRSFGGKWQAVPSARWLSANHPGRAPARSRP